MSASSKPCASSVPANDSSTTNTTRAPRSSRTRPIPAQLFVGPYAPSGKKTMVVAVIQSSFAVVAGSLARTLHPLRAALERFGETQLGPSTSLEDELAALREKEEGNGS